jgi:hypothetical protein
MIGAVVPTAFVGQTIAPLFIMVMLLFGGQLVNTGSVASGLAWLRFLSLIRYTYSSLARMNSSACASGTGCYPTGESVLRAFDLDEFPIWHNLVINTSMAVAYLLIAGVLFARKTHPNMKLR